MTHRERLEVTFALGEPDRTSILGGWIAAPDHIMALTGSSAAEYWNDPIGHSISAYEVLGMDGLIDVFVPKDGDYRCVDAGSYFAAAGSTSLDDALADIEAMPDAAATEVGFDFEVEYAAFRADLMKLQERCGDMVWMPAQWDASAKIAWYGRYGYENFFYIVGAYPEHAVKLLEVGGARGRCRSRLVARAVEDGLYPHAVLLGEDVCDQRGPMLSPAFLEKHFFPQLAYSLEPLLAVGCRPVWHSDGDIRRLIDPLLATGVQGFQGFQSECGVLLEDIVEKRTRGGEPLLIFGPLSVTTELPIFSPDQVKAAVSSAIQSCRGRASLVLFTANTINPDVPLANVLAMSEAVGLSVV